jgi:hypothetical protein
MAFVRIRKDCAELLTTRYLGGGRSQQVLLASLPGYYLSAAEQRAIEAKFPDLHFDWLAIHRALARGDRRAPPPPGPYMAWADVEHLLRALARREREHDGLPSDIHTLEAAAEVLTGMRLRGEPWPLEDDRSEPI